MQKKLTKREFEANTLRERASKNFLGKSRILEEWHETPEWTRNYWLSIRDEARKIFNKYYFHKEG